MEMKSFKKKNMMIFNKEVTLITNEEGNFNEIDNVFEIEVQMPKVVMTPLQLSSLENISRSRSNLQNFTSAHTLNFSPTNSSVSALHSANKTLAKIEKEARIKREGEFRAQEYMKN